MQSAGAGLAEGAPPSAALPEGTAAPLDAPHCQEEERMRQQRNRLASMAAGGQAKQYGLVAHGIAFTAADINAVDNTEIV